MRLSRSPWSSLFSAVFARQFDSAALSHRIREGLHGRQIKIQVYPGRRIFISKKRLSPKVEITTEETDFAYPDKGSRRSDPTGRFVPVKKNFKIKTKSEGNFLTEASRDLYPSRAPSRSA
ncbi:hypothetical protein NDU88_003332 [Pleurodeles waltl]|uniref:Uncharacterized protein n=1 Tax=Pleurodeles waltl TaxID=8319 RepID=A0AAV7M482_PLEWA|nr:hypothetical protein NDU88_003332 [Pleurodeles waltl]